MSTKKNKDEKYIRTTATLPPELYKRLERYCNKEERTISWCVQKALDMWLTERGE